MDICILHFLKALPVGCLIASVGLAVLSSVVSASGNRDDSPHASLIFGRWLAPIGVTCDRTARVCQVVWVFPVPEPGLVNNFPGLAQGQRKQPYSTYRLKLDAATRVQPTIPASTNRFTRAGQEDSQVQSPTRIGRNNIQIIISATIGNARTQFQNRLSHSGFTTIATANPTHSSTKTRMAYVLSTRGAVTSQNCDFFMVALLGLQDR